jgi:hypothetical protein
MVEVVSSSEHFHAFDIATSLLLGIHSNQVPETHEACKPF